MKSGRIPEERSHIPSEGSVPQKSEGVEGKLPRYSPDLKVRALKGVMEPRRQQSILATFVK
jgi:hypothetical protein